MFKAIKEFFVGKPKTETVEVEAPKPETIVIETPKVEAEVVVTETATTAALPETEARPITVSDSVTVTITEKVDLTPSSETVTVSTPPEGSWPFPNTPPAEPATKKKRTFVKREEPATDKKPTPAIKANKNKSRKKK